MSEENRSSFTSQLGFVLAGASSAVGLGNIWRFPYLAAKDNGGLFIVVYIILAITFGFTLLTTEIALGRKTKQGPLTAYGKISRKWNFLGTLATLVPVIILPYYCVIGGWVLKYLYVFATFNGSKAAQDGFFTDYITQTGMPIIWFIVFLIITAFIVFKGVNKGIEKMSKVLMPILLIMIIGISVFSLTLSYTDADGITRTGLEGLKVYLVPSLNGVTLKDFFIVVTDALGQLFFSISVAMGIMIAYGSYAKDETNLQKSINQIEIFDTLIALLAGLMIVPSVFVFFGKEGMSAGPGLMFISLPKVFDDMGGIGKAVGLIFFITVFFAAITSSVSVLEAITSSAIDKFNVSRGKAVTIITSFTLVIGIIVCLGYNKLYFEFTLPNNTVAQILDLLDYFSNNLLMPTVALLSCVLVGWITKPDMIIEEVTRNGEKFSRKRIYIVMIKLIAPVLLFLLLLQSVGII